MRGARSIVAIASVIATIDIVLLGTTKYARAQACCVGASGLTPGWLTNHERALVGAQLRMSQTHGSYPTSGAFYAPPPGRDTRVETSLFASLRLLPRGQASVSAPLVTTRRRAGDRVETRTAPGDVSLLARYDLLRAGEARLPGVALLAGLQAPTGVPGHEGTGLLAADVTGTGAWEGNAGLSVEQITGHVILHATMLAGVRAPHDVLGVTQQPGLRALYLLAGGWVFDDDTVLMGTVTHTSESDAALDGEDAPGTGSRTTQLALLVITPLTDTLRLRTTAFTDVPPLGTNRPALGGTSIALTRSW